MNFERISPITLMRRAIEFGKLGPNKGVSNFIIQGPIDTRDRYVSVVAGLWPYIDPNLVPGFAIVGFDPKQGMAVWNKRIVELQLPDRVRTLGIPDSIESSVALSAHSAINGWPNILLIFGKYKDTNVEFVQLFCVAGISPQTALKEIQDRAHKRFATVG